VVHSDQRVLRVQVELVRWGPPDSGQLELQGQRESQEQREFQREEQEPMDQRVLAAKDLMAPRGQRLELVEQVEQEEPGRLKQEELRIQVALAAKDSQRLEFLQYLLP